MSEEAIVSKVNLDAEQGVVAVSIKMTDDECAPEAPLDFHQLPDKFQKALKKYVD